MKKTLFLLPLVAGLMLCGCGDDSGGGGGGGGDKPKPKPTEFTGLTISGEGLYDGETQGYSGWEGDHDVDGYNVNFAGIQINPDPGSSLGQEEEADSPVKSIQFAKKNHDKAGTGFMTVEGIKPSSVTIKVLLSDQHSWTSTQIGAVKFGGKKLTVPSKASKEDANYTWITTDKEYDCSIYTVDIAIDATTDDDFTIENTNSFAFYILSLDFAA